jgi:hypothetical protein
MNGWMDVDQPLPMLELDSSAPPSGGEEKKTPLGGADESSSKKKTRYQTCLINTWHEW